MTHRRSRSRLLRISVLGSASGLLLLACESGTESRDPSDGFGEVAEIQLGLTRAGSCEDLLTTVQDNIIAQLGERAKQLRSGQGHYNGGTGPAIGMGTATPGNVGSDPVSVAPPPSNADPVDESPVVAPRPDAPDSNGGSTDNNNPGSPTATPEGEEGSGFSGTTVQVKDVDEADIVKTDGNFMYLLHGATLFVLNAWPAVSTEILASAAIEGEVREMFVRDGKAVVFSHIYRELGATGANAADPYGYYDYASGYTKLTVLDVASETPSVVRQSYIEGDYVSARRHDGIVRAVVQDGFKVPPLGNPSIEYRDLFGEPYPQADIDAQVDAWLERTIRSIRGTEIGDWLPREFAAVDGQIELQPPRCLDYYAPEAGLTESGVTSVVSLDLDNVASSFGGATILGRAERVYSNEDVVLLTQSDYRFQWSAEGREQTIIHRFDIEGAATSYTASGAVAGSIHDQFSLDERAGVIAVSTTEQNWNNVGVSPGFAVDLPAPAPGPVSDTDLAPMPQPVPVRPQGPVNRIVTLRTDGRSLEQIGATEDFGLTERIFATRFMGDRAYVVTFRQTDPLFVVDMEDPANPHVVGELHIPGFSNYMFPLGDDHLFAIGRDATPQGVVQGLALQIFDVSDPAAPALAHRYVFADQGDSPANIDHRAISFHADRDVVAFPHQIWNTGESTLEIFQLSAADGFARLGGMGMPETLNLEQCLVAYGYAPAEIPSILPQIAQDPDWQASVLSSCHYGQSFRRGVFRDDVVYGISTTGVYAYNLDALDAGAIGQVSLPAPVYDYGMYGGGGVSAPPVNTLPTMTALPPDSASEVPPVAPAPEEGGAKEE